MAFHTLTNTFFWFSPTSRREHSKGLLERAKIRLHGVTCFGVQHPEQTGFLADLQTSNDPTGNTHLWWWLARGCGESKDLQGGMTCHSSDTLGLPELKTM